jgi:hypothetical protein
MRSRSTSFSAEGPCSAAAHDDRTDDAPNTSTDPASGLVTPFTRRGRWPPVRDTGMPPGIGEPRHGIHPLPGAVSPSRPGRNDPVRHTRELHGANVDADSDPLEDRSARALGDGKKAARDRSRSDAFAPTAVAPPQRVQACYRKRGRGARNTSGGAEIIGSPVRGAANRPPGSTGAPARWGPATSARYGAHRVRTRGRRRTFRRRSGAPCVGYLADGGKSHSARGHRNNWLRSYLVTHRGRRTNARGLDGLPLREIMTRIPVDG